MSQNSHMCEVCAKHFHQIDVPGNNITFNENGFVQRVTAICIVTNIKAVSEAGLDCHTTATETYLGHESDHKGSGCH